MRQLLLSLVFTSLIACQGTPTIQTGPGAVVSHDGLTKIDNSRLDSAWVRVGIDLSSYDKLMLTGAGVKYRSVRDLNRIYLSNFEGFALDEEQRSRIQSTARDIFTRGITASNRFEIVTEPGPDTLNLTGSLIDVVSNVVPRDGTVDAVYSHISQLGEATLVLELSDSLSGQVIARATDRRILESASPNIGANANFVTNQFEFERELNLWVNQVRTSLEYLANTPPIPAE